MGLVGAVHAILQQVERHTETLEAELSSQTQLFEAEEILINVFCEVSTDELIAAVLESACTVCTNVFAQSRTLLQSEKERPKETKTR